MKRILFLFVLLSTVVTGIAQTQQGSQFQRTIPKPLEYYFGKTVSGKTWPWASVSEANTNIPITRRYPGHLVIIGADTANYSYYWYSGGTTNDKLVPLVSTPTGTGNVTEVYTGSSNRTISNTTNLFVYNNSSATSSATVTMPASPIDGQEVAIHFINAVTTLTVAPNSGQTISQSFTPTTVSARETLNYAWIASLSKWISK